MASVINTNTLSMVTQQNLNQSQNALNTSMERLSSGLRINSAKDDAAGQAIANRMDSQITGLSQAQRNANDGISIAQTAEGALNQVNDNLQRVRELTVQAQNGTNSASDIDSIQQEVNQRLDEINRISEQTEFNGINILEGSGQSFSIQVGAQDGQTIDITMKDSSGWNLSASGTTIEAGDLEKINGEARTVDAKGFDVRSVSIETEEASVDATDSTGISNANTASFVKDSDGNLFIKDSGASKTGTIEASDVTGLTGGTGTAAFAKDGSGDLYAVDDSTGTAAYYKIDESMIDPSTGVVTLDFSSTTGSVSSITGGSAISGASESGSVTDDNYYAVTDDMVDENGKVTADLDTLTAATSAPASATVITGANEDVILDASESNALTTLDAAIKSVDDQRSDLGAVQNRFDSAITNLATTETNLASAQSRIQDADYAEEVSSMTTAQILQQAGTSMLTQANQVPQNVLSLLG
ncbi:FliC/FljB family flagellin [Cobetia amphilecti]|uniref:FliC/FljB family flagellin n=1 Tax=Cobetia amphilecti TaxID=1055104 RepID=UPI001C0A56F5|nr:FliC/FljB family flagellin [Cobetia amphilecti]MBU3008247.1 FliC/FljB family flagellin [Cobetia amphilecti]